MTKEKIEHIAKLFDLAENRLQIIEARVVIAFDGETRTGLFVPTINQLRYAGRHLIDYLTRNELSELHEAEVHCKRAIYDSYHIELAFYINQFKAFQDQYAYHEDLVISEIVHDYFSWVDKYEAAQRAIAEKLDNPDAEGQYGLLSPHIDELNKIHVQLPHARDALSKRLVQIEKERKRDTKFGRYHFASAVLGIFGLVGLGITFIAWMYPDYFKELRQDKLMAAPITAPVAVPGSATKK